MQIPASLLNRYNVPVPRYTSYPPANHFSEEISEAAYLELVDQSNDQAPDHMAFYVHIPFCRKICFYCGCNACTARSTLQVEQYLGALTKEILKVTERLDPGRLVTQVHFGGGTPNSIPAGRLAEIVDLFASRFRFSENAEIAVELNPAYLEADTLDTLTGAGFNRFSLGIQDFNRDILKRINREPSAMPVEEIMKQIRSADHRTAVNLDFIYGLPGQTPGTFTETIEKAISLQPDRLVTFAYAHVPWLKKHQQVLEKYGLPGAAERTGLYLGAYRQLKEAGYVPVGLDHFVRPDDELFKALKNNRLHRNFQGYCTRETTGQVYAFGNSAIGQLSRAYVQNKKNVDDYIAALQSDRLPVEKGLRLSADQLIVREVITRIMCNKEIHWEGVAADLNVSKKRLLETIGYEKARLEPLAGDGLIEFTPDSLRVTETGGLFTRNVAVRFDPAYEVQQKKYSKSV